MRHMCLLASWSAMLSSSSQRRGVSRQTISEHSDYKLGLNSEVSRKPPILLAFSLLAVLFAAAAAFAQQQPASAQSGVVPPLINFSGTLTDIDNKPITGITGISFNLYKDPHGGSPLWMETQNVQADENGHYSVMLGSTTSTGVPSDVFASGEARWLGVQPEKQEEQPRVLLVAVPYALKAGDAETIGGLPASAFVLAGPQKTPAAYSIAGTPAASVTGLKGAAKTPPPANPNVTGVGKVNFIPLWDTTSDIVSSIMSQAVTTVTVTGSAAATTDFRADIDGLNNAGAGANFVSPGIRFGTGNTGEALSSQRANCTTTGCINNVNGLDLDTDFISRLSITNTGNVGIGTRTPADPLTVTSSGASIGVTAFVSNTNGNSTAIEGSSTGIGTGVWGSSNVGVLAQGTGSSTAGLGIWALSNGSGGLAGQFVGNINVTGSITAAVKNFRIDHPSDPANKYLYHASIESSEMINLYTGNATLDDSGEATVQLPNWFQAENEDFRYSLTCVGGFAPVYIAEEISGNHFKIAGGKPGMKISWQVSGIRQDAYAKAHPLQVEVPKPAQERGYYIHPELYGAPEGKSIEWANHPQLMKQMKEQSVKGGGN